MIENILFVDRRASTNILVIETDLNRGRAIEDALRYAAGEAAVRIATTPGDAVKLAFASEPSVVIVGNLDGDGSLPRLLRRLLMLPRSVFFIIEAINDHDDILSRFDRHFAYSLVGELEDPYELASALAAHDRLLMPVRVLVVDDSQTQRSIIRKLLSETMFNVEFVGAQTGVEAVIAFAQNRPDLAIIDYQMPTIDGVQTIRMMRAIDREKRFALAYAKAPNDDVLRNMEVDYLLQKPFDRFQLDQLLGETAGTRTSNQHLRIFRPSHERETFYIG